MQISPAGRSRNPARRVPWFAFLVRRFAGLEDELGLAAA
jgi:hypothetical protein